MFSASSLITTLTLALAVAANPVLVRDQNRITLPIAKRVNFTASAKLLEADQARAKSLRDHAQAKAVNFNQDAVGSFPVTNQLVDYVASVGVGSPATTYSLLIDTGSSNTWLGAGKAYVKTSTSVKTGDSFSVTYGSGSVSGTEYTDKVTLGSLSITAQSIGVASRASGFSGVDGILGVGPVDLTVGTLSPHTTTPIPTVTDNLFSQGQITSNVLSVFFAPTTSESSTNGELTFGGVDSTKYTGSITYTPVTSTSPASYYWGINQSVRYGASTNILSSTAGIVDTGTTLTLLATDAITRYKSATGAVLDSNTGLLRLTTTQYNNLQSLFFTIGGTTFELTANAQIWPRNLNADIGGDSSHVYLIVADLGSSSGQGLDFIDGLTFLERFYSVYDTANKRVGIATTANTYAASN